MSTQSIEYKVLIYGASGALGSHLVNHFKNKKNYWVLSIDLKHNSKADSNIIVDSSASLIEQEKLINESLESILNGSKLNAILNVAGGWAGGNVSESEQFLHNCELMCKQSVWSSVIAASIASKYLSENGLLSLPGAAACLQPTPDMIAYGMAKSAIHHLTKSLADHKSGLPNNSFVFSILPITLDTPMNRKYMTNADFSTWTPLSFIADMIEDWIERSDRRPLNGSLVKLETKNGQTEIILH